MYQSLYRKYRPSELNDVVGQDIAKKILNNAISRDNINHAYLFFGPRGCGKTSVAKIIAKTVNCSNLVDNKVCGKCVFCTLSNDQKIDIIEIDAASNNGVDEIREIRNKVSLAPSSGKYKIYIIDEVHMLTIGAFNALLKTLEEPPKHVIFILATTDPQKIPSTILSRCQKIEFKPISNNEISRGLKIIIEKENISISEDAIEEICRLADGGMRDAINLLDQVRLFADEIIGVNDIYEVVGIVSNDKIEKLINDINDNNVKDILDFINELNSCGKNIVKITEQLIHYLRFLIYKDLSNSQKLIKLLSICADCLSDMRKSNNPVILFEISIIQLLGNKNDITVENKLIQPKQHITEKVNNHEHKNINTKFTKELKNVDIVDEKTEVDRTLLSDISKENISREINVEKYNEFIKRRINNALATFSKKELIDIKEKILDVNDYFMDDKFKKVVPFIIDSELKICGDNYLIFVCDSEASSELFNEHLVSIETLLSLVLDSDIKALSINNHDWEIIKQQFNNKEREFHFEKEDDRTVVYLNSIFVKDKEPMESLFGNIIEYS